MTDLAGDDAIDRDLLIGELEAARFAETELREETWNPLDWVYLLGGGLFSLLAREFAPLGVRLASVAGRLEGLPEVVAAARATIVGHGGRPVGRFQTETALKQLAGIEELIADALAGRRRRGRRSGGGRRPPAPRRGRRDGAAGHVRARDPPPRRRAARERGRGPARRRSSSRRRCATRCARTS